MKRRLLSVFVLLTFVTFFAACGRTPAVAPPVVDIGAGRIHGLAVGDPIDSCLTMLGEPPRQEGGGADPIVEYIYPAKGLSVSFVRKEKRILLLELYLDSAARLPEASEYTPPDATVDLAAWGSQPVARHDRLVIHERAGLRAYALERPDGRRLEYLALSAEDAPPPRGIVPLLPRPAPTMPVVATGEEPIPVPPVAHEVILQGTQVWQGAHLFLSDISSAGGQLRLIYQCDNSTAMAFATSRDGKTWNPGSGPVLRPPDGTAFLSDLASIPGTNRILGWASGGDPAKTGLYEWTVPASGAPGTPRLVKNLVDRGPAPTGFYPGNILRVRDRLVMIGHGLKNGRAVILRSESRDGRTWSEPTVVLGVAGEGEDAGSDVSEPSLQFDPASNSYTLWYITYVTRWGRRSGVLCRARSADGVTFTQREIVLHPAAFGENIEHIVLVQFAGTGAQASLHVSLRLRGNAGTTIARVELPGPHTAPVPFRIGTASTGTGDGRSVSPASAGIY